MEFHALLDFIKTRMRMAHIYQPVMIRTLLDHQGEAEKFVKLAVKVIIGNYGKEMKTRHKRL